MPGQRYQLGRMHSHTCGTPAREAAETSMCPKPHSSSTTPGHALPRNNMARTSRWIGSPVKALACVLLAQLSFVDAQVAEIEKASNDSLLWGPYRPNLYFGVRPRIPKSLMGGLLWTKVEDHTVQHSKYRLPGNCPHRKFMHPAPQCFTGSLPIA